MIGFVILHYQAIDETKECVNSIKKNVDGNKRIVIVDNASPNQTGKELDFFYKEDSEVDILLLEENKGFAKGNNIGFNYVKRYNPNYVVVLNSDTLLLKDNFVSQLETAYKKYSFDILGPDIYSTKTKSHQNPQNDKNYSLDELYKLRKKLLFKKKFKFLLWLKYFFNGKSRETISEKNYKEIQTGKILHGSFYVFSKKFIDIHTECFYNETFMYFESYLLHYYGMKNNLILLYYPMIQIVHHEDASTDLTYTKQYQKSIFVNDCLYDSCQKYIQILEKNDTLFIQ